MKEILIYLTAIASSMIVLGYTVHMFIGGLVSPETEKTAIISTCLVGAIVIALLAWDVVKRRRGQ
jgi:hypothetical protein